MANRKNTFLIKRSNTQGKVPSAGDLLLGELALNTADVILYASGTTANSILPIGWDRVARTGDTMTGTLYGTSFSANTISATTFHGNGDNITGLNTRLLYNDSSNGVIEFSGLTFTPSATTYSVSAIKAWFVDNTTSPLGPTRQYVEIPASSGNTLSGLTGQNVTYIAINSGGTISQQSIPFTPTQRRSLIRLGVVIHSNKTFINAINNQPSVALSPTAQLYDLVDSIRVFNVTGNTFSANGANLNINKSAGEIFKQGSNFVNDPKNPHIISLSALTAPSNIRYRLQNGDESSNTSVINPNTYDDGLTGTTVPDNKYTVQRIYLFQSNLVRIQYGQNIYDSIADAVAGILGPFNVEQNLSENGLLRGYLIVKKGTTGLTDTTKVKFIEASRFGLVNETNLGLGYFRTQTLNNASTGVISGGTLVIASTGGTLNISGGTGIIVDNFTVPNVPTLHEITWPSSAITITNVNTQPGTAIYVTTGGTFYQTNITNVPSGSDARNMIFLGGVGHPNSALTLTFNNATSIASPISQINDLTWAIGPFAISGNRISKITGTLNLLKSIGKSYFTNGNFQTDRNNPSIFNNSILSASTLSYVKQNAFLGGLSTSISTTQYDNGGTLTAIPTNDFVAHRIWYLPVSNLLLFQYGQATYTSLANARSSFVSENFIVPDPLTFGAYLVAVIIVREGETNLDNPARAEIIPQSRFAGTGSGGGASDSLQSTYNNSVSPEIAIDSTRGAVSIINSAGTANNVTNLIEGLNSGNTITSFIRADGGISGSSISATTFYGNGSNLTGIPNTFVTGATTDNSNKTYTFTNNTGGTFTVTGLTDVTVTGGTYSSSTGIATLSNNTGGTFNITGFFKPSDDVKVTGFTYSNNLFTITNNTGGTNSVLVNTMTGLTINGNLNVTGLTTTTNLTATTISSSTLTVSGVTFNKLLTEKVGFVAGSGFTGNPKKSTITFGGNFIDTNYAIIITGGDNRSYTYESQTTSGFTINANANTVLTNNVYWMAKKIGEV